MTKLRAWWRNRPRRRWCPDCELPLLVRETTWQKHLRTHRWLNNLSRMVNSLTYPNSTR